MKISILTVGTRMPEWVQRATAEYQKRMPVQYRFRLIEIAASKRSRNGNVDNYREDESTRLLSRAPKNAWLVALSRAGQGKDSAALSELFRQCQRDNHELCFLIGGADGLSTSCLRQSHAVWSLSAMTLAHPVVRVVLAEQLYRAWSILEHKPYHRG